MTNEESRRQAAYDEGLRLLDACSYSDEVARATYRLAGAILVASVIIAEGRSKEDK
jgi:hypothetical protein